MLSRDVLMVPAAPLSVSPQVGAPHREGAVLRAGDAQGERSTRQQGFPVYAALRLLSQSLPALLCFTGWPPILHLTDCTAPVWTEKSCRHCFPLGPARCRARPAPEPPSGMRASSPRASARKAVAAQW